MNDDNTARRSRPQISLLNLVFCITIAALAIGYWNASSRLKDSQSELAALRKATGYLGETPTDHIAAIRSLADQPLTYRVRLRVPDQTKYRVAYSSIWEKDSTGPKWFGAVPVPSGDSTMVLRILKDPRDESWKITTLVQSVDGTKRSSTVLPEDHVVVFRGSHDVVSTGVPRKTTTVEKTASLRLLDERWIVGEGSLMLYGDKPPERDQIGIYVELQPDVGPL